MALTPGTRLGPYEIREPIGAGGMGEVYRARDTKLDRDVAIKVLPEEFAADPERLARFEREAKLLASLNHPNIAAIHGFEESDGVNALVLELVEGPTLAERIEQGPIPVDEAIATAKQIAEALEAGHEAGVIHRDLKPANIKLKEDGTVKVLDYGLAKALEGDAPNDGNSKLSQSPTLTRGTQVGVILGTAAYMAPEQAKGKRVDRRADVWAFGAVVYEMLTAKRAFEGEDVSDTLAFVLTKEPAWEALPGDTPGALRQALRACLQKDPKERVHAIADARLAMKGTFETSVSPREATVTESRRLPWLVATVSTCLATGVAVWSLVRPESPAPLSVSRFAVDVPFNESVLGSGSPAVALSPDGTAMVYVGGSHGETELYLRRMDQLEASPIAGTRGALSPFFSFDGQWIGFEQDGHVKRASLAGGPPVTICALDAGSLRGASWGPENTIVFATLSDGLSRVSALGATPEVLTTIDREQGEQYHIRPEILPGGEAILLTTWFTSTDDARIDVYSIDTGERRPLLNGTNPRLTPTGHLVFARLGSIWGIAFDTDRHEVSGDPVPLVNDVFVQEGQAPQFALASTGILAYVPFSGELRTGTPVLVDRDGKAVPIASASLDSTRSLRISPDGQRFVVTTGRERTLWVHHINGQPPIPLASGGRLSAPVWSPDGSRVAFRLRGGGESRISLIPTDGNTLDAESLLVRPGWLEPASWSRDGAELLFVSTDAGVGFESADIWALSVEGDREAHLVLGTKFKEIEPALSADGRWLAYVTDRTGRDEVWVMPYPGPGTPIRVSANGGKEPAWGPEDRELFYLEGSRLMSVSVELDKTFSFEAPQLVLQDRFVGLYQGQTRRSYDVAPDGRFLMIEPAGGDEARRTELVVVQNWFEELKRLVPTGQ